MNVYLVPRIGMRAAVSPLQHMCLHGFQKVYEFLGFSSCVVEVSVAGAPRTTEFVILVDRCLAREQRTGLFILDEPFVLELRTQVYDVCPRSFQMTSVIKRIVCQT
jgi:hypothetical protein